MKKRRKLYLSLFLYLIFFSYTGWCDPASDLEYNIEEALKISRSINEEIDTYIDKKSFKKKSVSKNEDDIRKAVELRESIKEKIYDADKNINIEKSAGAAEDEKSSGGEEKISGQDKSDEDRFEPEAEDSVADEAESKISSVNRNSDVSGVMLNLDQTVEKVVQVSLKLQSAEEKAKAADAVLASKRSLFLPSLSGAYQYKFNDEAREMENSKKSGSLSAAVSQTIFTGFALKNQYKIASYGLKTAHLNTLLVKEEVILDAKEIYFSVLKAEKLYSVAKDTVEQLTSHKDVAENFYLVGMVPLNDFLKTEVALANATQLLVTAENNLEIAKTSFNMLLRRSQDTLVNLMDVEGYVPFEHNFDYCMKNAEDNRIELKIADMNIDIAEISLKLAERNFYPSVSVNGNLYKIGGDWNLEEAKGLDQNRWDITASASWELFDWGKTYFERKEKRHFVQIAKNTKEELENNILVEVKSSFLRVKEAEINIRTSEKAVRQAKENFRINQERYIEQVATSTDVLDAQTLLTETMRNYYNALYDFSISKSRLEKAIGVMSVE